MTQPGPNPLRPSRIPVKPTGWRITSPTECVTSDCTTHLNPRPANHLPGRAGRKDSSKATSRRAGSSTCCAMFRTQHSGSASCAKSPDDFAATMRRFGISTLPARHL